MKTLSLFLLILFLSSCGGGGGSSTSPVKTLIVSNSGEFDFDKNWSVQLNATGLDSSSVAYSIDNLPIWMSLDSVSGQLSGEGGIPGDYRLVAKATDSAGDSVTTTFDISFKLYLTGDWNIDFLPGSAELNYSEASDATLFISRGGATGLISSSAFNQGNGNITQRCSGNTFTSGLGVQVNLNCVAYSYYDEVVDIIEYFKYEINGELSSDDLIDGETSNLTITKLSSAGSILNAESDIYLSPEPFFTVASSDNNYLVWVDNEYSLDGLYYNFRNGDKAIVLDGGRITTLDISEFNPFTQYDTVNSVWDDLRDSYRGLWDANRECEITGNYNNIDGQWFENYDTESLSTYNNTIKFADAMLTISNCQQASFGSGVVEGAFDASLNAFHANEAYTDNNYDINFSDSESIYFQVISGNTLANASYLTYYGFKICEGNQPSIYALWRITAADSWYGVSLTADDLTQFCATHQ